MDFDPDAIYREVIAAGEDWADKKAAYEALDDNTKSVLSDIALGYMDGKTSKSEAELRALASKPYRDHLSEVKFARRAWLLAQVKYDSLKMLADMRRSQESTRRAEMGLR
jgi:hypothetical protein